MSRTIILCISDLQAPFEHKDALDFTTHVLKYVAKPKPEDRVYIVNQGDEVDQHTLSKYASDPDGMSGGEELDAARSQLVPWMIKFPKMLICESNHTYRAYKKGFDSGIPKEFFRSLNEVYKAPKGWEWAPRWEIDGILFEHGESVSGPTAALNAAIHNRQSTVIGHQHSHGGVIWSGSVSNHIFGMNTGCLIDVDKYAFKYGQKIRRKPTLGCGLIIDGIPMFIPMILNQRKRWIGRTI